MNPRLPLPPSPNSPGVLEWRIQHRRRKYTPPKSNQNAPCHSYCPRFRNHSDVALASAVQKYMWQNDELSPSENFEMERFSRGCELRDPVK
ncbi:phytanoyl-CoA dioxygenase [Histoplasma capsulatum G186AR]|uniref:Phytanoyl-CoA dioxygenase n=1 Tax=Ajellomyces capsulatus TaxID=5037 RepID=A0A8H7YFR9_AJECA|nr:phytanoyl-CoA dioxygenase [Histoplasma capsulatum]QSS72233.1 phytanoyl-CoA dioxygenase [Histoplasma capsulatum G186AR]